MIYSVSGTLAFVEQNHVVIECGGIGYSIKTSMMTISKLPTTGEQVKLFTHLAVKEDAIDLYGFYDEAERTMFKLLIGVSGVGPKGAVSVLSNLSPERFALAVASGDAKAIRAPGIGPKTAERIVLELRDKVSKEQAASGITGAELPVPAAGVQANAAEAISALEVLGYARAEATNAVSSLDGNLSVEELIKRGLKALAGKV